MSPFELFVSVVLHNEPLSWTGPAFVESIPFGFSGFVAKAERRDNFMDAL